MPRSPTITRTVTIKEVTVLCLNVTTGKTSYETHSLATRSNSKNKILKAIKELHETEDKTILCITEIAETRRRFKMPEAKFVTLAELEED